MKTYLVCWSFELCKLPKCCTRNFSINKTLYVVENSVISHWAFNNIIIMRVSAPARHNKIKPFFSHSRENKYTKIRRRNIIIFIDYSSPAVPRCPTLRLFLEIRTVEAEIKILMIFRSPNFRKFDYFFTAMINNFTFYDSALLAYLYLDYNKSRRYRVKNHLLHMVRILRPSKIVFNVIMLKFYFLIHR